MRHRAGSGPILQSGACSRPRAFVSDWGELVAEMELVVSASGDVSCIYGEELDLRELGKL